MHKLFPVLASLLLATLFFLAAVRVLVNFPEEMLGPSERALSSLLKPGAREERRGRLLKPGPSQETPPPLLKPETSQSRGDALPKPDLSRGSQDTQDSSSSSPSPSKDTDAGEGTGALPSCPEMPVVRGGRRTINSRITVQEAQAAITGVRAGGSWWPSGCAPRRRMAVVVAFRNREAMLGPFLYRMHPFLQQQFLNYTIYLVEQTPEENFNQAKMYNVGFVRARAEGPWDCYVFHDVDCLPENDQNLYFCTDQPRHLGVSRSKAGYRYNTKYLGCANALTGWQVERVNGWSNRYFGWGGEDNDMLKRITASGMNVIRMNENVATYTMLNHPRAKKNPNRRMFRSAQRTYKQDGLNTLNYTLVQLERRPLYTWLFVHV